MPYIYLALCVFTSPKANNFPFSIFHFQFKRGVPPPCVPCIYLALCVFTSPEGRLRTRLLVWYKNPSALCVFTSPEMNSPSKLEGVPEGRGRVIFVDRRPTLRSLGRLRNFRSNRSNRSNRRPKTYKSYKSYISYISYRILPNKKGAPHAGRTFSTFNFDQADACSKMLSLGIACKQSLLSLTRICQLSITTSSLSRYP